MISISPQSRVLVQVEALDFRKGMDSIVGLCSEVHQQDPFSGTYFLFRNRSKTAIRIMFLMARAPGCVKSVFQRAVCAVGLKKNILPVTRSANWLREKRIRLFGMATLLEPGMLQNGSPCQF